MKTFEGKIESVRLCRQIWGKGSKTKDENNTMEAYVRDNKLNRHGMYSTGAGVAGAFAKEIPNALPLEIESGLADIISSNTAIKEAAFVVKVAYPFYAAGSISTENYFHMLHAADALAMNIDRLLDLELEVTQTNCTSPEAYYHFLNELAATTSDLVQIDEKDQLFYFALDESIRLAEEANIRIMAPKPNMYARDKAKTLFKESIEQANKFIMHLPKINHLVADRFDRYLAKFEYFDIRPDNVATKDLESARSTFNTKIKETLIKHFDEKDYHGGIV